MELVKQPTDATRVWLMRYGFAVLAVVAATALHCWLEESFGFTAICVIYSPVAMPVALAAGLGPGLVATLLSAVAVDYLLLAPRGSFAIAGLGDRMGLALFLVVGAAVSLLAETLRRRNAELRRSKSDFDHAQAVAEVGSWHLDVAKDALTWSEETYRLFEIPIGIPVSRGTVLERVPPEDHQKLMAGWDAALEGAPSDVERRLLRAPLRHVSGFSKILTEEYGSSLAPDAQHHLQRIREGTRRMGLLVDDLLSLGRIGRHEARLQATGLNSLVNEVVDELKSECEGRQVEWKIGSLPFVECDPGLMKQVFQNGLSNAVKFTRPRSQAIIEVGQKDQEGTPVVFVRDNGVGFNMKYADKLFGVFQRLHRAEDFDGTGVGLATAQRIVQKHGGRVWAEAEVDKGATFYFTLGVGKESSTGPRHESYGGETGVSPVQPGGDARLSTSTRTKSNGATAGGQS